MDWTLREKTKKEIEREVNDSKAYSHMVGGFGKFSSDVCPLVVTKGNGEVKEVWNLSEHEIAGLISTMKKDYETTKSVDKERFEWTHQILECWGKRHNPSARLALDIMRLKESSTGYVMDMVADFASKPVKDAEIIANYLNGMNGNMKPATNEEIMQVLENMVSIKEMSNSRR